MLGRIRTTLPTLPGALLGYRKDGSPIRLQAGGSVDAGAAGAPAPAPNAPPTPPAPAAPAPQAPTAPAQPAASAPTAAPAAQPAAPASTDDLAALSPTDLAKMVRDLRNENASARTTAKQTAADEARAELAQTIGKALGLVQGDEPADPAKLTEQLTATQAQARQAAVELAVFRAAPAHQGDPNALLDSRSFLAKVADLDPTAADFAAKVDAAIKDAVSTNSKLKTAQAAGASGADHAGGPGEQRNNGKPVPLDQAVSAHYGA
jgi:hypothetical protein